MSFPIFAPAPKGQIKCFRCRVITRSKNGAWHNLKNQQVFLCASCAEAPPPKTSPAVAHNAKL